MTDLTDLYKITIIEESTNVISRVSSVRVDDKLETAIFIHTKVQPEDELVSTIEAKNLSELAHNHIELVTLMEKKLAEQKIDYNKSEIFGKLAQN